MARVPVLAIALLLASVGGVGLVYLKTQRDKPQAVAYPATHRPPPQRAVLPKAQRAGPKAVVPVDRVAQAVASTSSAPSFTFTYTATISAAGRALTMSGDGSYDVAHRLAAMNMQFAGAPQVARLQMSLVLDNSDGFVEYLRSPELDGHLPAGKSWIKLDVGALAKKQGIDLGALQQGDSADPSKVLSVLRRTTDPVAVGTETVDGTSTTHYTATVDPQRIAATTTDPAERASLERAIALTGASSYPVDVWIDGSGYLRRVRLVIPERVSDGTQTTVATMTVTEDLANFGAAVSVAVPPAASVVDVADLRG